MILHLLAAAAVGVMGRLGYVPARYAYVPKHHVRLVLPVIAADEDGLCTATHALEPDQSPYECELEFGHDTDHSAFGGAVTWPREMAVAKP